MLVVEHAKRIAEWVAEVHGDSHDDDFEAIIEYILQATKERDLVRTIFQHVDEETQESLMSVADWLRARGRTEGEARGRTEGEARGRTEGEARMLSRLLTQRFGRLPRATGARIRSASIPELERWASRLLAAASLDAVFTEP